MEEEGKTVAALKLDCVALSYRSKRCLLLRDESILNWEAMRRERTW